MNAQDHLNMLINRAYFENEDVYRALMAHRDVVIQEREKKVQGPSWWELGMKRRSE